MKNHFTAKCVMLNLNAELSKQCQRVNETKLRNSIFMTFYSVKYQFYKFHEKCNDHSPNYAMQTKANYFRIYYVAVPICDLIFTCGKYFNNKFLILSKQIHKK